MNTAPAITSTTAIARTIPTADLITQRFIADQDVKPSSKALYTRTIRQYFNWIEKKGYRQDEITRAEVQQYKEDLLAGGHSPLTVGAYLTAVRKFYTWAEANKYYLNVAKGIKTPAKNQVFEKETLTDAESCQLNKHYQDKAARDYAIVNLVQLTGLRTIEVARANIEDLTIRYGKRVLMIQGKGRDAKDQPVLLTDAAYKPIAAYLNTRLKAKAGEPLFISASNNNKGQRITTRFISGLIKEGLRAIGLDDRRYSAHSLRHTVGTRIYEKTGRIDQVQIALRHTSPVTSQIYARKAIQKASIENSPLELINFN
jgi:integrase/recombinase XerD